MSTSHDRAQRFEFEGEQLTVTEVHKRMPAYGRSWIYVALQGGCTTRTDFARWEFSQKQRVVEGGKRGRVIGGLSCRLSE